MNKSVLCYGEVLWDMLPHTKMAGGAPMNVAFHLNQLGLSAEMISRVGSDPLGDELLSFLEKKQISTNLIQRSHTHPTGIVEVELDAKGSPSYTICQNVAWDYIESDPRIFDIARQAEMIVFGSLACRNPKSRNTLFELLDHSMLRVLDVNLRIPYYDQSLIEELLIRADIVKLSDEELTLIAAWFTSQSDEQSQMLHLAERFSLDIMVLTKGKEGAVCLDNKGFYLQDSFPIQVQDTIGSGDAFLAAFLQKMLNLESPAKCLEFACATGALVATFEGSTPLISESMIDNFIKSYSSQIL